jgi:hypothetical protein
LRDDFGGKARVMELTHLRKEVSTVSIAHPPNLAESGGLSDTARQHGSVAKSSPRPGDDKPALSDDGPASWAYFHFHYWYG